MTLRSGKRPRDGREFQARPFDPDAYATETVDGYGEPPRRRAGGGGGGSGLAGLLKFLVFALVLAAVVLIVALTALRPLVKDVVLDIAEDNPAALQLPFVKDIVREDLGASLTDPVSDDPTQVEFVVEEGDTARSIAARLAENGLLADSRAFIFIAIDRQLTGSLRIGDYVLRRNLTPDQLVTALLDPPVIAYVDISFRTGLRLEQMTAKLQLLGEEGLEMEPRGFFDLASSPRAALIADYAWLAAIREDAPDGASLEGFLWPGTYRVLPDTTPEELIRLMLDKFVANVGQDRLDVPSDRGLNFYQVMTLASIVEREAVLDDERALIAGVYQNRIDGIEGVTTHLLNADPTVFYAIDTVALDELPFDDWQQYSFWSPPGLALAEVQVPEALQGFQTYQTPGLIPWPICTPSLPSIDAALEPDTAEAYIYFLAIPDGGGTHAFARTKAEHDENRRTYGYIE